MANAFFWRSIRNKKYRSIENIQNTLWRKAKKLKEQFFVALRAMTK